MPVETLPAFTREEFEKAYLLLSARVAHMMGRKLEEGDWSDVYCRAKNIPVTGWSNLNIDVMHNGLGVEHKMLRREESRPIRDWCGQRMMHPSLTRSIRIDTSISDAEEVMSHVIQQYDALVEQRRAKVREVSGGAEPDLRSGWLIYQSSLRQFLYFEERLKGLDPALHRAEWSERVARSGARKASRSLWIFNRETGQKVWSVTTEAGIKIQPYFDVPPPDDPNLYIFVAQGMEIDGMIRVWLTVRTAENLKRKLGSLDAEAISRVIIEAEPAPTPDGVATESDAVQAILITPDAYELLATKFTGVSDEHSFQLLLEQIR